MDIARELEVEAAYADHMGSMAHYWMERAQRQEREALQTLGAVILAAGGEVRVHFGHLEKARESSLERWNNVEDMTTSFKVREKR